MKKTNFTTMTFLKWVFVLLTTLSWFGQELQAQAIACNDLVQVSVDGTPNTCQATVTADMILEGNPIPGHNYEITITYALFPIATGINQVTISGASQYFGTTLTVTIKDLSTQNSCWGQMVIEDKLAPVITCTNINVGCSADLSNLPLPTAVDNCDPTPTVQLSNEVVNSSTMCSSGTVTITRSYVAIDDYGNTSQPCNRIITVTRPTLPDFPNDIIWTCEQYNAFPNIVLAEPLHPYVGDGIPSTAATIDVKLNPACDDQDLQDTDFPNINSTSVANGGPGCPGLGLDDADVLDLTGSGIVSNIVGQYCNYQQTKHDATLTTCGSLFKIIRTWTVLNWCTGAVVTVGVGGEDNVQVIKIVDDIAPSISRAPYAVNANLPGVHPQPCRSTAFLLPATFSDNCNTVTVKIYTPVGEAIYTSGGNGNNGGLIPAPGLPIGTHNITYQATDACGNQTNLVVPVTVSDQTTPVAICDEITDVNLSTDGKAVVPASTFDDGSWDNCCLGTFSVRRMNAGCNVGTSFGPNVTFCCADIGGPVQVVFRVTDCNGNDNECMVSVNVSDKLPPTLTHCPANQRITCDWYADNLETTLNNPSLTNDQKCAFLSTKGFGTPTFYDNCSTTLQCNLQLILDNCFEGTIVRQYRGVDPAGNVSSPAPWACTQRIFVDHVSDFVVEFPEDRTVQCTLGMDPQIAFGLPEIFYETCELVAVSHHDSYFDDISGACYKVVRKWTVINWCVTGANVDQEVVESSEREFQVAFPLEPCDMDGDGDCDTRTFRDSWRANPKAKPSAAIATQSTGPDTDLDTDPWDGFITYEQVIKVVDDVDPVFTSCTIPDVEITDNTCAKTLILPVPPTNDCSRLELTARIKFGNNWVNAGLVTVASDGEVTGNFTPFFNVAPGTYEVEYKAIDECNNWKLCNTTVKVVDKKKPTPYCKYGLVIELMVTDPPMVTVWASDFNVGSFDNCPGQLVYSFSSNVNETSRVYDCDDLGQQTVQLWVTDAAGNQDFCETFVVIQANMNQCNGIPLIASVGGSIANEESEAIENVNVSLSGQSTGSMMTNNAGGFVFGNVPFGNDVTVTPEKNDDPLNGVTTFDLVLISKHILGVQPLDSPYKIIAADANKSNSVTTADLLEIRRLILQINQQLPNNNSWRFVDKDYVFPNPANPFAEAFPEVININDIPSNVLNADFVAVKICDVNNSASFGGGNADRSAEGQFPIVVDDIIVNKGQEITVPFMGAAKSLQGLQFTLNFKTEALEFVRLGDGVMSQDNFGFAHIDKGVLTASWNGSQEASELFFITFTALKPGRLSEMLNLNSAYTLAEAYGADNTQFNVSLQFNNKQTAGAFELYQNTPNPFRDQTVIGFNLPEAGYGTLTISDVSGKIVLLVDGEFAQGFNEIRVNRNDLPATGVFYYTLDTATGTDSKKLIIVD
jgi:hypothetical protein